MPEKVRNLISYNHLDSIYAISFDINPSYLRGDYNGDGVIDLDLFLAIPEVAWLWLDLVTRSDCADAARRHHPWSGGFTIGGYLAKNYKVLCRLWYRDLFNTPS